MTRLFRPRPSLEAIAERYASAERRHRRPETVVEQDRQEHADALRGDPGSYRWVGGTRFDVYDVPNEGDA